MVLLGLPKGRLWDQSRDLLTALGVPNSDPRCFRYVVPGGWATAHLLKMRDIPRLVLEGILDAGVAPDEWIEEAGRGLERLSPVGVYDVRVCLLGLKGAPPAVPSGATVKVATEFPSITGRFFRQSVGAAEIIPVYGSAEACVPDLADMVVDCVETGDTAARHGLAVVAEILKCRVHLVCRAGDSEQNWVRRLVAAAHTVRPPQAEGPSVLFAKEYVS